MWPSQDASVAYGLSMQEDVFSQDDDQASVAKDDRGHTDDRQLQSLPVPLLSLKSQPAPGGFLQYTVRLSVMTVTTCWHVLLQIQEVALCHREPHPATS